MNLLETIFTDWQLLRLVKSWHNYMICPFLTHLFLIRVIGVLEPIPAVTGQGGETHPGQVMTPSQDTHTINSHVDSLRLEPPINLMCLFLGV